MLGILSSLLPCLCAAESIPASIILNQVAKGQYFVEYMPDGDFLLRESDLGAMGFSTEAGSPIEIDGERFFSLRSIPGVEFTFDERSLTLEVTAQPELLGRNVLDFHPKRQPDVHFPRDSSVFLNYALDYFDGSETPSLISLLNELGIRSGDLLFLTETSYTHSSGDDDFVRLMTSVIHDDRTRMRRAIAGDFFAFSGDLGSAVNMGGLSYSKLFAIDPYFVQRPMLNVSGAASVPSEVDVYFDGTKARSARLSPGTFEVENIAYYTGSRDVDIVIRDAFGREQRISVPYYFTDRLLRKALHEYSYNLGVTRDEYGIESDTYRDLAFSGFHRYGFTDSLTAGVRAEGRGDLLNLGALADLRIDTAGILGIGLAGSAGSGDSGLAASLVHGYQDLHVNTQLLLRWYSRDYETLAPQPVQKPRAEIGIGGGYGSTRFGSLNAGYSKLQRYEGSDRDTITATYAKSVTRSVRMYVTYRHVSERETSQEIFFGINYYPWKDYSISASVRASEDYDIESLQVQKDPPVGEGYGFRGLLERGGSDKGPSYVTVNPSAQFNARHGILRGDYVMTSLDDSTVHSYRLGAAGAIAYIGKTIGFTRPVYDSFGLVKVGDLEGIGVYRNNQIIGTTDSEGKMFVPDMNAFADNQVSLRHGDVPIEYYLPRVSTVVSPPFRSGSCILFEASRVQEISGKISFFSEGSVKPLDYHSFTITGGGRSLHLSTLSNGKYYFDSSSLVEPGPLPPCTLSGEMKSVEQRIKPGPYEITFRTEGRAYTCRIEIPESEEASIDLGDAMCEESKPDLPAQTVPGKEGSVPHPWTQPPEYAVQAGILTGGKGDADTNADARPAGPELVDAGGGKP